MTKYVNTTNHQGECQNVMFHDGAVRFEETAYVGVSGDNIYTAMPADYTGTPENTPGILSVRPRDPFDPRVNKPEEWDTVLAPAKDSHLENWRRKP